MAYVEELKDPAAVHASPRCGDVRSWLLQIIPDTPALLTEVGGCREQAAATDGATGGLNANSCCLAKP